jgi:uncharacterized protein (TIGR02246 family)
MKNSIAAGTVSLMMAVTVQGADLKEHLFASEKALWAAWSAKDGRIFQRAFAPDAMFVVAGAVPIQGREVIANEVANNVCTREKFVLENVSLRQLAPTVVEISYDAMQTGECDGTPLPVKVRATSIYLKQGATWLVTLFQETPVELE